MRRFAVGALSVALVVSGCGDAARRSLSLSRHASARDHIVNGTDDSGDPAVVEIAYFQGGVDLNNEMASCTGELIGPHTVMTAGHCCSNDEINPNNLTFCGTNASCNGLTVAVLFGSDEQTALSSGNYILVDDYQANPNYSSQRQSDPQYDIGLMHLAASKMQSGQAEPALLDINQQNLDQLYGSSTVSGVRFVGFGISSGNASDSGVKRQVTKNDITMYNSSEFQYSVANSDVGNTCSGDSGGPAFLTMSTPGGGTHEFIIGVTSRGDYSCQSDGIDTRTDAYVSWIASYMSSNNDAASCGADGRCALGCTSPDPDCDFSGSSTSSGGSSSSTSSSTSGGTSGGGTGSECSACSQDSDCGAGGYCVGGTCTAPCDSSGACSDANSSCFQLTDSSNNVVGTGCYPSSQSCSGWTAGGSATSTSSSTSSTSTSGGTSGGGSAAECSACSQDADCGAGGYCVNGTCTAPCDASGACSDANSSCFQLTDSSNNVVGTGCYPSSQSCSGWTPGGSGASSSTSTSTSTTSSTSGTSGGATSSSSTTTSTSTSSGSTSGGATSSSSTSTSTSTTGGSTGAPSVSGTGGTTSSTPAAARTAANKGSGGCGSTGDADLGLLALGFCALTLRPRRRD